MTKQELLQEIERSRQAIARDYRATRTELDFRQKLLTSVRARPFALVGAAAVLGWILAGPKTRTRIVDKSGKAKKAHKQEKAHVRLGFFGMVLAVLKLTVPMLKPAFSAYAARRFAEMAQKLG